MIAAVAVEEALVLLKIGFLVLLYLFIWRIVRTASKDLRLPQESFILGPHQAEAAGLRPARPRSGELVVLASPALRQNERHELDSTPLTVGRSSDNDIALEADEFASSRHARLQPQRDGVWLEDVGSTNGTFVNGVKLTRPRLLEPGDVVRIGETDFRFER